MSNAFVDVESGQFEVWVTEPWWDRAADFCTQDPKEAAKYLAENGATSLMKSSSLDFPEDYDVDPEVVQDFYEALQGGTL